MGNSISLVSLRFLWYRKRIDRIRGIVFGVIPAYHNKGLETGMIMNFYDSISEPERN